MSEPEKQQLSAEALGEKLTDKQRLFCDIYLSNGLNARAAAREAKYKNPSEGSRTLALSHVEAYVRSRLEEAGFTAAEIARRLEYFATGDMRDFLTVAPSERSYWVRAEESEEVREGAKRRGVLPDDLDNYDLAGIVGAHNVAVTEDGVLMVCIRKVDAEVSIDWRGAERAQALGRIRKLKIGKDGSAEFELHDPVKSLELLGRAQRMFADRQVHENPDGSPIKFIVGLGEDEL